MVNPKASSEPAESICMCTKIFKVNMHTFVSKFSTHFYTFQSLIHSHIYIYIHIHTCIYIYICIWIWSVRRTCLPRKRQRVGREVEARPSLPSGELKWGKMVGLSTIHHLDLGSPKTYPEPLAKPLQPSIFRKPENPPETDSPGPFRRILTNRIPTPSFLTGRCAT